MKKIILLLLISSLMLFACGCGADDGINNSDFTLTAGGVSLSLGPQTGEFPWGAELVEKDAKFWQADGFKCFDITCADGTKLRGCRAEGREDATDGTLMFMETADPAWQTPRGVCVGMSRDAVLKLYPEANFLEDDDLLVESYEYHIDDAGFYQLVFNFEKDTLISLIIADGMDGYLY